MRWPEPLRCEPARVVAVLVSATEASRCGQSADDLEAEVEQERQKDAAEGSGDGGGDGVHAADASEAGEDRLAEPGTLDVGSDGGDAHDQLGGDPDAGEDHRP